MPSHFTVGFEHTCLRAHRDAHTLPRQFGTGARLLSEPVTLPLTLCTPTLSLLGTPSPTCSQQSSTEFPIIAANRHTFPKVLQSL